MSNGIQPPAGLGIGAPAQGASTAVPTYHTNAEQHEVPTDLPGGKTANFRLRIGTEQPGDADARREQLLTTTCPRSLTEGLEKELARLEEQWKEHDGWAKDGTLQLRYTGREREMLEMKMANRRNALQIAWRDRRAVEAFQQQKRNEAAAADKRINAAAEARARELVEQAEIERRAKQIAARNAR